MDAARETLQLARQVVDHLPLRSLDDVVRAVGEDGRVRFRSGSFNVRAFGALIPSILFPVDTVEKLVTLAALVATHAPKTAGLDLSDPGSARRVMRRAAVESLLPDGRIGPLSVAAQLGRTAGGELIGRPDDRRSEEGR